MCLENKYFKLNNIKSILGKDIKNTEKIKK